LGVIATPSRGVRSCGTTSYRIDTGPKLISTVNSRHCYGLRSGGAWRLGVLVAMADIAGSNRLPTGSATHCLCIHVVKDHLYKFTASCCTITPTPPLPHSHACGEANV